MVDLKELKKLIKYLRKEGITEFKADGFEFKLGPEPAKSRKSLAKQAESEIQGAIDSDYPSEEELLFMSAGGPPPKDS